MEKDIASLKANGLHVEEGRGSEDPITNLKVDKHGLPLVPQPTDSPCDPFNWPYWQKVYMVVLIALLSFTVQVGAALINPALVELAEDLHVSVEKASYCTTVYLLFGGVTPLFVVPFANIYGRRMLYIIFIVIAAVGHFISAASSSYGGVIAGRAVNGIGASMPLGIGAATICDLFTQNERGVFMGIYTVSVTNGPHFAPIIGGYIAQRLGWRWAFWIPGIILAGLWFVFLFAFPETLFSRVDQNKINEQSYARRLLFHGKVLDRKLRARDFLLSLRMVQYIAVAITALWYCTANAYGSPIFSLTGAYVAEDVWGFDVEQVGLFLGVPQTVGCFLGEMSAGWVSDMMMQTYAKRHNGYFKAEVRLWLLPFCVLLPIGTATYGYCVQYHRHWIEAAVCMATAGFGLQVGTTMVYLYCTDSYKAQSGEIGVVMNLFKSVFAFNIGFYVLDYSIRVGFAAGFATFAAINAALLIPVVGLLFKGEGIRAKQGVPKDHQDL